jgi:hypothetical protein
VILVFVSSSLISFFIHPVTNLQNQLSFIEVKL